MSIPTARPGAVLGQFDRAVVRDGMQVPISNNQTVPARVDEVRLGDERTVGLYPDTPGGTRTPAAYLGTGHPAPGGLSPRWTQQSDPPKPGPRSARCLRQTTAQDL